MSSAPPLPRDGIDAWLHDVSFLKEVASPSALDLSAAERRTLVPKNRVPVSSSGQELAHILMALLKPKQHSVGDPSMALEAPKISYRDSVPHLVGDIAAAAAWARTAGDPEVHGFEVLTKMRYNLLAKAYVLRAREVGRCDLRPSPHARAPRSPICCGGQDIEPVGYESEFASGPTDLERDGVRPPPSRDVRSGASAVLGLASRLLTTLDAMIAALLNNV